MGSIIINQMFADKINDSLGNILNCPNCDGDIHFEKENLKFHCSGCKSDYLVENGIIDFLPNYKGASDISQKTMESSVISKIYERYFRPIFSFFGTDLKYKDEINWLEKIEVKSKPNVIVDLACGSAKYGRLLSKKHHPGLVVCIDLSMAMLEEARKNIENEGLTNLILVRASIDRLPIKPNSIDWLNCFGALHLFPDTSKAFVEINRVLKPASIFTCLTACLPKSQKLPLLPKLVLGKSDFKFLSVEVLLQKLQEYNFLVESTLHERMVLLFKSAKKLPSPQNK